LFLSKNWKGKRKKNRGKRAGINCKEKVKEKNDHSVGPQGQNFPLHIEQEFGTLFSQVFDRRQMSDLLVPISLQEIDITIPQMS
jgi:hypothetical protein